MFGMIWSAIFLGETITWPMLAGCALVVAGAYLVVRPAKGARVTAVPVREASFFGDPVRLAQAEGAGAGHTSGRTSSN